jgi:hypothetical protein
MSSHAIVNVILLDWGDIFNVCSKIYSIRGALFLMAFRLMVKKIQCQT